MESKQDHSYTIRNVEDGQLVSLTGDGEFCIGLTLDEKVACCVRQSTPKNSKLLSPAEDGSSIAVPLMLLTVWRTSGVTVSPASRDLRCKLNGLDIGLEAHFIPGSRIEVGDKVFELHEGTVVKPQRRHLPPTPGIPIHPTPPPKPQRASSKPTFCDSDTGQNLREWYRMQLPNCDHELLQQAKEPSQLASLASSYLTRHIVMHTDVVMSAELADHIFRMMQEVAHHRRDILRHFLTEVIDEKIESQDNSHHSTVTSLLVEILQQFLDPGYLVVLCLQLLRALSHIPGNVATMVMSNTTAAVLGSMAAYKDDQKVQNYCLDILAKMATYMPAVLEKPPMRESSIDLVAMALSLHAQNLTIVQAGIRTLANLASTLQALSFVTMTDLPKPDLRSYLAQIIIVLDYLYDKTQLLVRDALGVFCSDLTVKTDGRRFLFEYARLDQLKSQQKLWNLSSESMAMDVTDSFHDTQSLGGCRSNSDDINDEETKDNEINGSSTLGILKKSRSFESLRTPNRRVSFINEDDLPPSSCSSSDGSVVPAERDGSPDIQVLSCSRIYLADQRVAGSEGSESAYFPEYGENVSPANISKSQPEMFHQSNVDFNPSQSQEKILTDIHFSSDTSHTHNSHIVNSNGTSLSNQDDDIPVLQSSHSYIPVDLASFSYSAADVIYMKRLVSLQIMCHVCSSYIRGLDPPALKLIDMPLSQLLSRPGIPNAMCQFTKSQFNEDITLMDIDPGTVISIIDAVRYKILTFDLIKKSLEVLLENLSPKVHALIFDVTREVIESIITDTALSSITSDQEFLDRLEFSLEKITVDIEYPHPVSSLFDIIRSRPSQQDQQQN